MMNAQYQPAPDRTSQILRESAIVAGAIARHRREATSQGRLQEAREMEILGSGLYRMVLECTRPHQHLEAA